MEKARRKTRHSNIGWVVTIRPSGPGDIAIRLPARACGEANAVCFDNRPLAEDATPRSGCSVIVWVERNPAEVWNSHPKIGRMAEASDQSPVAAEIGRDRSMNVDLQLETRVALANIVWDGDGKWRTMANEAFYPAEMSPSS